MSSSAKCRIFKPPHACLSEISHSHLHFSHWADALIETGSQQRSWQVFHQRLLMDTLAAAGIKAVASCAPDSLTAAPASRQQRFNYLTAAPCSRQTPAQVPFIVASIINKEWKAPGEQAAGSTSPHRNVNYVDDSEAKCILTSMNLRSELRSVPDCLQSW